MLGELGDEGRHVAELAQTAEPGEGRNGVVTKPLFDDGESEIPCLGAELVGELDERPWDLGGYRLHTWSIGIKPRKPEF
jgi:hypothetical protein